jgi:hypothetical protein
LWSFCSNHGTNSTWNIIFLTIYLVVHILFYFCKNWHHTNKWAQFVNPLDGPQVHHHHECGLHHDNSKFCAMTCCEHNNQNLKSNKVNTFNMNPSFRLFLTLKNKKTKMPKMVLVTIRLRMACLVCMAWPSHIMCS